VAFDVPSVQLSDHLPLVFDFEVTAGARPRAGAAASADA
jgi:hypothetical protein